jgi:cyclopropane fatty-acyl-phospholipid synthase-like methyltransferase
LVSTVIKNWDNKTWLSTKDYIKSFNNFLTKQVRLDSNSKVLDIGCGRGRILGTLSSKLKLKSKPLGIDIINHKDKDKRIIFKKINASIFFKKNQRKFDLILIKQTIHLFNLKEIKKLLSLSKKNLSQNGKIVIFTLDYDRNEFPTFKLMKTKLTKSLKRDKKILKLVKKLYSYKKNKFVYKVNIIKKKYLRMVKKRYISTLLFLTEQEIQKGINEINLKYKNNIKFNDNLICVVL